MIREEEIIEAGIEYTMQNSPVCIGGDNFYEQARMFNRNRSFEAGAKWAEEHLNLSSDMAREERIKALLVSMLGTIAEAADMMESESTDCGIIHCPVWRYAPMFEFTDEDIQLIKSLEEEMMEDFSMLTES